MRQASVIGQFYPADKLELEEKIKGYLKKADAKANKIKGGIAPHASYIYSGQCAACTFKDIKFKGTVILLGVNHSGYGKSISLSFEDFETPLGIVKNDKEFVQELLKVKGSLDLDEDIQAHSYEHSLEVQLPFLQTVLNSFKIVPVILKDYTYESCKKLAQEIFEVASKLKRDIFVLASSDFTHYGKDYGFVPFVVNVKDNIYKMDMRIINFIEKMDSEGFLYAASKTTICGTGAIAAAIELCKLLGAKKAKLLKYYTSGDVSGDYRMAVGYGSLVFV